MKYYVYILRSEKFDRHYVGISQNPQRRILEHNMGCTKSTKGFRPYILQWQEECLDRVSARQLEKYYKSGAGRRKIKKLFPCSSAGRASGC